MCGIQRQEADAPLKLARKSCVELIVCVSPTKIRSMPHAAHGVRCV